MSRLRLQLFRSNSTIRRPSLHMHKLFKNLLCLAFFLAWMPAGSYPCILSILPVVCADLVATWLVGLAFADTFQFRSVRSVCDSGTSRELLDICAALRPPCLDFCRPLCSGCPPAYLSLHCFSEHQGEPTALSPLAFSIPLL